MNKKIEIKQSPAEYAFRVDAENFLTGIRFLNFNNVKLDKKMSEQVAKYGFSRLLDLLREIPDLNIKFLNSNGTDLGEYPAKYFKDYQEKYGKHLALLDVDSRNGDNLFTMIPGQAIALRDKLLERNDIGDDLFNALNAVAVKYYNEKSNTLINFLEHGLDPKGL